MMTRSTACTFYFSGGESSPIGALQAGGERSAQASTGAYPDTTLIQCGSIGDASEL